MKWFRLYTEILDDPKVTDMSATCFRLWINLMATASSLDDDGKITWNSKTIAKRIRMRQSDVKRSIKKLIELNILTNSSNGLQFINWEKRQFKSDLSTSRVKRFRNGEVTPRARADSDTDTETDT